MRVFASLIELKNFVPQDSTDYIVQYKYPGRGLQIYYWYGCWIQKIYWTVKEAAEFIEESEEDVFNTVKGVYAHLYRKKTWRKSFRLSYEMLGPVKHMIEQTKTVEV